MSSELYLVQKIVEGRVVSDEHHARMRNVELARQDAKRPSRVTRRHLRG